MSGVGLQLSNSSRGQLKRPLRGAVDLIVIIKNPMKKAKALRGRFKQTRIKLIRKAGLWLRRHHNVVVGLWSVLALAIVLGLLFIILDPFAWLVAGSSVQRLTGNDQVTALN